MCAVLLLTGCSYGLPSHYGSSSGLGTSSVNGTRVLADMFSAQGHEVESRHYLSPRLYDADAIVWFPDDFDAPSPEVCEWLDEWLLAGSNRTLIYVGRDFDAAPLYWNKIAPQIPAEQKAWATSEQKEATIDFNSDRSKALKPADCQWFKLDGTLNQRDVRSLAGPWSADIDASQIEIELNGRLNPILEAEKLLTSEEDVLVSREVLKESDGSQVILVANGSLFLNLPLVNHEHRKLAGKLVETVGTKRRVVFLESGPDGPKIYDKEPTPPKASALAILGVWPLAGFLLHLAVLGIIFCFACWPIFGRPREPAGALTADFGKHVSALGQLLARTRDREYALTALERWRGKQ